MAFTNDEGNVKGGYRIYGEETPDGEKLYRVPDLLNEADFIQYMSDVYGETVSFA